jgi:hypothetical protein
VLLALRSDQVWRATAWKDARLRVEFSSGRVLAAYTEGPYESWEVDGSDYQIVGTPGEVTIWDEDTPVVRGQGGEQLGELLGRYFESL